MDNFFFQFCGPPCGRHGPYTFFKSLKYKINDKTRSLSLGDFFFIQIGPESAIAIGEIQLLWEDKNNDTPFLSSVRLYFLPQNTPEGRNSRHGRVSYYLDLISDVFYF